MNPLSPFSVGGDVIPDLSSSVTSGPTTGGQIGGDAARSVSTGGAVFNFGTSGGSTDKSSGGLNPWLLGGGLLVAGFTAWLAFR